MTVATEACYAERQYTGAETEFAAGFSAQAAVDVHAGYFDADGLPVEMVQGAHFTVTLGAGGAVTVGRLAFPTASPLAPLILWFERVTPAIQGVNFSNLAAYDAGVHERLADAAAMRAAELRNRQHRTVMPFVVGAEVVDFRPLRIRGADPEQPDDVVTKRYSDEFTGTAAAAEAKAYRDEVVANAATVAAETAIAVGAANAAEGFAVMLENPDYGFVTDAPTETRDYGTLT